MPAKQPKSLFKKVKGKRVEIDPELLPELGAYLVLWLVRAEDAARTQQRMMVITPDGTPTTNPTYYRHAAGYLRHMLYRVTGTMPIDQLEEAKQTWLRAQERPDAAPETAGGEG